jgi:hypothetical protein
MLQWNISCHEIDPTFRKRKGILAFWVPPKKFPGIYPLLLVMSSSDMLCKPTIRPPETYMYMYVCTRNVPGTWSSVFKLLCMPDLKHRDRLPTCDQEFARRRRDKLPQQPLSSAPSLQVMRTKVCISWKTVVHPRTALCVFDSTASMPVIRQILQTAPNLHWVSG